MKTILLSIALISALIFSTSCEKESTTPVNTADKLVVHPDPCDTCFLFCVSIASTNPLFTFDVFHNNNAMPVNTNFPACVGDTISMAYTQDCITHGFCDQWAINVMHNNEELIGSSGSSQSHALLYIVPG